jgi:hypothetical protein
MKSNQRLRQWSRARFWSLVAALPLLAAAEGWMVARFLLDWQREAAPVTLPNRSMYPPSHPILFP